ncbi:uncharacterized protein F4812DRAFT_439277 [Daldinia caldariorum]|uniref:uncharacterized protein n=1 Tax=Daldinia caldariorum TaxID=326644 RepID=UPI0020077AB1|nr:uncharacterized protein F4812DRAFT_439277 [Daldinia caldariorum]KAI1465547.1 hypothetical protein F4812DRAFT_439277 [Daldinia caldariorum]
MRKSIYGRRHFRKTVSTDQQRTYLSRVAVRFGDIIKHAMGTQLNEQSILPMNHQSPLMAHVQGMSKIFTSTIFSRGTLLEV